MTKYLVTVKHTYESDHIIDVDIPALLGDVHENVIDRAVWEQAKSGRLNYGKPKDGVEQKRTFASKIVSVYRDDSEGGQKRVFPRERKTTK
jgi:hypothetical protein